MRRSSCIAIVSLAAFVTALAASPTQAQCAAPELQKVTAGNLSAYDQFGRAVAIGSNVAVVGARYADGITAQAGGAYVYRFDGHLWIEEQRLVASDGLPLDEFGHALAIDGNLIVVGARLGDSPGTPDTGAAYFFRHDGTAWVEEAKVSDGVAGGEFGYAVDLQGDVALVGARLDDGPVTGSGAAYVYRNLAGSWTLEQKLLASDGDTLDCFGAATALDGNLAVVGAYLETNTVNAGGAVYVYRYDGTNWIQERKLLASDRAPDDRLGISVDVDGDWVIAGAYRADKTSSLDCDSGAAYIFHYAGGSWSEDQKLTASDGQCGHCFGLSVGLSGSLAVVGSFLYEFWVEDRGAAYAFRYNGTDWLEELKLLASDGDTGDLFGTSVAVSGETVMIGAFTDDCKAIDTGSAYLYQGPAWTRYGTGTPGTNGITPTIRAVGCPTLGNHLFDVIGENALPRSWGTLLVGFKPLWSIAAGWELLVDMRGPPPGVVVHVGFSAGGSCTVDMPIPNNPYLDGLGLYLQFLIEDPGAANGVASTAGLKMSMYKD
ncbi:MAG: FG-GAP repeat protein [Planctomycetota bacterium]